MLYQKASDWDLRVHFLDKSKNHPAGLISPHFKEGDFKNYDDVLAFAKCMDIVSIEIENVNTEALKAAEEDGIKCIPSSRTIAMIKDKGLQKQFYKENNLPTSAFKLYESADSIKQALNSGEIQYPFVQKSREAGYDGKGVSVINDESSLDKLMDTPSVIEKLVDIDKELAIIVARNEKSHIRYYETVEMVFDPEANLLDYLLCPAEVSSDVNQNIRSLAEDLVNKLDYVGLLAIELFLDKDGQILINEVAPRTHNSGHHTIDACNCSQFEMQLRTMLNLDLPEIKMKYNYVGIVNIVGDADTENGPVKYHGLEKLLDNEGIFPHIYAKFDVKPFRKMGHVTVCADSKEMLLDKIQLVKNNIKARS